MNSAVSATFFVKYPLVKTNDLLLMYHTNNIFQLSNAILYISPLRYLKKQSIILSSKASIWRAAIQLFSETIAEFALKLNWRLTFNQCFIRELKLLIFFEEDAKSWKMLQHLNSTMYSISRIFNGSRMHSRYIMQKKKHHVTLFWKKSLKNKFLHLLFAIQNYVIHVPDGWLQIHFIV